MNFPIIASKSTDMKFIASLVCFLTVSSLSFAQLDYAKILGDTASAKKEKKINIAVQFGAGTRTGVFLESERENNRDFARMLNYGFHVQVQPTYFLRPNWGIGLVASVYGARSTGNYETAGESGTAPLVQKASQTDGISFAGLAWVGRYKHNKFSLQYSFAGGVQAYMSELKVDNALTGRQDKTRFEGLTWSVGTNLHIGYQVIENLDVFISPSYYFGLVDKGRIIGLDDSKTDVNLKGEERIDVSRFSLGLGAAYNF